MHPPTSGKLLHRKSNFSVKLSQSLDKQIGEGFMFKKPSESIGGMVKPFELSPERYAGKSKMSHFTKRSDLANTNRFSMS